MLFKQTSKLKPYIFWECLERIFMQIGFVYTVGLGNGTFFAVWLRIFAPSLEKIYALVSEQESPNVAAKKRCLGQLHKYTERFLKNMLYGHSFTIQIDAETTNLPLGLHSSQKLLISLLLLVLRVWRGNLPLHASSRLFTSHQGKPDKRIRSDASLTIMPSRWRPVKTREDPACLFTLITRRYTEW